jgi:hypothetical protein
MHPTYILALIASAFAPTLNALPNPEPQSRQPAAQACKDKPYPQNLNCPGAVPPPQQQAQPYRGGSQPPPYQPINNQPPTQGQAWPNSPYTPLPQSPPQPYNQPQPYNPSRPAPAPQPKQSDKPYIQNDGTGFTIHGPLGTFHRGPDGTYIEGSLGVYDSQKGGPTTIQGGLGTITTGNGMPKYDPKATNKNPTGTTKAGGSWRRRNY